jgi:hypothetical protein
LKNNLQNKEVALAITTIMHRRISWPEERQARLIQAGFANKLKKNRMPHVLGCLDGTHVEIAAPANSGGAYKNYKGRSSINVLGLHFP